MAEIVETTSRLLLDNIILEAKRHANSYIDDDTIIAKVEDIVDGTFDENYVIIAILTKLTHVLHDAAVDDNVPAYKKHKKNYDRIFQFSDIAGVSFCVICESDTQSRTAMGFCVDMIAVGAVFVLVEPKQEHGNTLR